MNFKSLIASAAGLMAFCGVVSAQDTFTVKVVQPEHGKVTVTPPVPEDGVVKAGTVLDVKVSLTSRLRSPTPTGSSTAAIGCP